MASLIHPRQWKHQPPLPVRRVWIPKPGTTERRPLAILTMIDRCKQALVKLALEPEWEAQFETHSYGFRPGRGTHDALAAILVAIQGRPTFVFNADIEGAFDHVNQAAVLEKLQTYPALRQVISAWLTAGVMDGHSYSPSETGIAQGGILSPLLMNVALHGMEAVVADGSTSRRAREQPLLVRYADNFVILHANLKELQQAVRRLRHWLATLGLHLHAHKTRLTHTLTPFQGQVGFDFLGFHIRQESGANTSLRKPVSQEDVLELKTIVAPSAEAAQRHLAAIDHRVQQLQTAPQARVIKGLHPLIASWSAYYNGVVPVATMSRYDELLEQRLLRWAGKRHPGKEREWLLTRYWHAVGKQKRRFSTHDGLQLRAYQQANILNG
jgi:RNA-directed DNA polymerase